KRVNQREEAHVLAGAAQQTRNLDRNESAERIADKIKGPAGLRSLHCLGAIAGDRLDRLRVGCGCEARLKLHPDGWIGACKLASQRRELLRVSSHARKQIQRRSTLTSAERGQDRRRPGVSSLRQHAG